MNQANRKAKLSKYMVRVLRQVEYIADIFVDARSVEEAEDIATRMVDNAGSRPLLVEHSIIGQTAKARRCR